MNEGYYYSGTTKKGRIEWVAPYEPREEKLASPRRLCGLRIIRRLTNFKGRNGAIHNNIYAT